MTKEYGTKYINIKHYSPKPRKKSATMIKEGDTHQYYVEWHLNGVLKTCISYLGTVEKGIKDGRSTTWNVNKVAIYEANFRKGVLHGGVITRDNKGNIIQHTQYDNGVITERPIE